MHHHLIDVGAVEIRCLLDEHQAPDHGPGRHDPTHAQAGREDLGERAAIDGARAVDAAAPRNLQGQDGRLSSSKFQWFVWTIAAVGGFSALFAARALRGASAGDIGVPANILIALGFSTATMATAKGITTAYIAGGRVDKSADKSSLKGGILTDDDGIADLSKIQLITWTIIAIAIWI